ncbi:MAG TPA: type II toxin-antitoxin system RelE/ParE family toxin [Candidatus Sumerlaeota bacterium]|nr:type II toxin-antitoxin system RelE/ParE family toxin [Candidatus Sumerlaeota bacterium]
MTKIAIVVFQTTNNRAPLLEWLDKLSNDEKSTCYEIIEQLREHGNQLDHPHAHFLEDGIYALRARHIRKRMRILYFFFHHGQAVLSHGIVKKDKKIDPKEIAKAKRHKEMFISDPEKHTYYSGVG